jgi:ABC-type dipeptide/oligopeptide/nickel transport system permease component
MLRYALRRVLWAIPTLFGISFVLFLVTTLAPDPAPTGDDPAAEEARRSRFADLPRFFNMDPQDVTSRAKSAVLHIAADDAERLRAEHELQRLGGAALPTVLPALEALPPEPRGRLAVALAPVAERMRLGTSSLPSDGREPGLTAGEGAGEPEQLSRPDTAALFWSRFWDDRALDFTRTGVDRAVIRLVEHGSDLRESDLVALDTYALPEVLRAMGTTTDRVALERLTRIARHATGRGPMVRADATPEQVRRAVADWREWWFVHGTDFVPLAGADRALALVSETRYGKWLRRAAGGQLGVSAVDGEPIADRLRERAPLTLLVCGLAMLASWLLAIPIGALGAWRQGRLFDLTSGAALFLLYATPTFAVAELLRRIAAGHPIGGARVALAVVALTAGSVATQSRWQRAAMLEVVRQDYVRTAHAKGLPAWRVAVVHALRNALLPTVTLAGLHLPSLLGGAFVVEAVFGLPGVGFETLRAIEAHDAPWLMAVVLASAVAVTAGLVASDVAWGALDPRVREVLARRHGERLA